MWSGHLRLWLLVEKGPNVADAPFTSEVCACSMASLRSLELRCGRGLRRGVGLAGTHFCSPAAAAAEAPRTVGFGQWVLAFFEVGRGCCEYYIGTSSA